MEKHTHEPPPWHAHPDSHGGICDAKGNVVADTFAGRYSIDQILEIRRTILKAVNLHDELAELVVDLAAYVHDETAEPNQDLMARVHRTLEKLWDTEYQRPTHWLPDMSCVPVPGRLLTIEQVRKKARDHVAYGWAMRLDGDWSEVQREAYMHEWKLRGGQ